MNIRIKGNYFNIRNYLESLNGIEEKRIIKKYAEKGLQNLIESTPKDTKETSKAWDYKIVKDDKTKRYRLEYTNDNITKEGTPIVILLQYGHGTKNGVWVEGQDFINHSLKKVFDDISQELWKEVVNG